jgi:hypothetical protein
MTLSREEQETIIHFDEAGENADIYTASKRVADKLIKRGVVPYKTDKQGGRDIAWYFELPKHTVALKPGKNIIRLGATHRMPATAPQTRKSVKSGGGIYLGRRNVPVEEQVGGRQATGDNWEA